MNKTKLPQFLILLILSVLGLVGYFAKFNKVLARDDLPPNNCVVNIIKTQGSGPVGNGYTYQTIDVIGSYPDPTVLGGTSTSTCKLDQSNSLSMFGVLRAQEIWWGSDIPGEYDGRVPSPAVPSPPDIGANVVQDPGAGFWGVAQDDAAMATFAGTQIHCVAMVEYCSNGPDSAPIKDIYYLGTAFNPVTLQFPPVGAHNCPWTTGGDSCYRNDGGSGFSAYRGAGFVLGGSQNVTNKAGVTGGFVNDVDIVIKARNTWPGGYGAILRFVLKFKQLPPAVGFDLTPHVTVSTNDPSNENPSQAQLHASIENNTGLAVNDINWSEEFWYQKNGSAVKNYFAGFPTPNSSVNVPAGAGGVDPLGAIINKAVSGLSAGDKICATLTIDPGNGNVNPATGDRSGPQGGPETTAPYCITIADIPYTKILGNDLFVGGGFGTAGCTNGARLSAETRQKGGDWIGSSAQFAAYVMSTISGFTTANMDGPTTPVGGGLSFANDTISPPFKIFGGDFGGTNCVHDYWADSVGATPINGGANNYNLLAGLGSGKYKLSPAGGTLSLTAAGDKVNNGKHLFLFVAGNVYFPRNITYQSTAWTSEANIPVLYIVASGHIYIDPTVTALDGIYIAQPSVGGGGGTVYTCAKVSGPYANPTTADAGQFLPHSSGPANCHDNTLTIRGSVIANRIKLLRTKYSLRDSVAKENYLNATLSPKASEYFIFTPELYLADICSDVPAMCASSKPVNAIVSLPPIL